VIVGIEKFCRNRMIVAVLTVLPSIAMANSAPALDSPDDEHGSLGPTAISETEPRASRLRLDAGVFFASPTALETGILSGAASAIAWPIQSWLAVGGQTSVGFVEGSNLTYKLNQTEIQAVIVAEPYVSLGRGKLGFVFAAGVLAIHENRSRHGSMRIAAAGLEPTSSTWTSGPVLRVGPSLRLNVVHRLDFLLQTDLTYGFARVDDKFRGRLGWSGLVAIGYRL
jgi:hypothetical protein